MWNHSVFSKNRDRLIEHDAVTELFNATVEMAEQRGLLSGEHVSVDGTLIRAWASHKSKRRKDGSDDGRPPEDWRGEPRSNATHQSKSDPESRLYRISNAAPALPSYLGQGRPSGDVCGVVEGMDADGREMLSWVCAGRGTVSMPARLYFGDQGFRALVAVPSGRGHRAAHSAALALTRP